MHQLFRLVLGQRDLSRAGDLFSLDDSEIEDCLSQALEEIKVISCAPHMMRYLRVTNILDLLTRTAERPELEHPVLLLANALRLCQGTEEKAKEKARPLNAQTPKDGGDYLTNDNDQAVVEICITRITTAIRETGSIEKHGAALVSLWESCLEHNLQPQGKDEDTPHAKIASDITSCILQNYNRPPVMALAVPVAVRFLQQGNQELSRNMSSYLSLAAIAKAELLAQHTEAITCSVLGGRGAKILTSLP
ncbi:Ventricular zone-expressed PH domain-containing protein [Labeo rohita]|uniref:Ventricular zone-expressed PH domain-containing protein n=2 Tax=Labeonini TaxID=2743697 RepID=A0ABQ8LVE2_LABRO|nr:Ventricular zone-expressed PH domain-containing protein [Labeo rohita]